MEFLMDSDGDNVKEVDLTGIPGAPKKVLALYGVLKLIQYLTIFWGGIWIAFSYNAFSSAICILPVSILIAFAILSSIEKNRQWRIAAYEERQEEQKQLKETRALAAELNLPWPDVDDLEWNPAKQLQKVIDEEVSPKLTRVAGRLICSQNCKEIAVVKNGDDEVVSVYCEHGLKSGVY